VEELLAYWYTDVNLDLAVAFNVGIAVASKNGIDPIEFLKNILVESIKVIININRRAVI
jgi:hypothetical protein